MRSAAQKTTTAVEATVTSKGQVTLPRELRKILGVQKGSRVRFSIPARGAVRVEPVLYELEDLWKMADAAGHGAGDGASGPMTFEQMDVAKAKRRW